MKKLVNQLFQKEISFDVLRGKPPDYSDLYINSIHFAFLTPSKYSHYEDLKLRGIGYLQLSFSLHKSKRGYRKKTIKINEQKINIKYLRRIFDNSKELKETDESAYLAKQSQIKEKNERLDKIRERNNIKRPEINLYYSSSDLLSSELYLTFSKITEDDVDHLMSYWNRINAGSK